MNNVQIIRKGATGQFIIVGDLTFSTISKETVKSMSFLSSANEITLDLNQVGLTDSAGLALMVEWVKYARGKRCHAVFKNIPEQLRNLAKLSGLETFGIAVAQAESDTLTFSQT